MSAPTDELRKAIEAALLDLADDDVNEDGYPVIIAWGVPELAAAIAQRLPAELTQARAAAGEAS